MKSLSQINNQAEKLADDIFRKTGDKIPSILSLIKLVEVALNIRISVKHRSWEHFDRSGLMYYVEEGKACRVIINSDESDYRQNFTLCHEIGHILRNSGGAYGFSDGDIYTPKGEER